MQGVWLRPGQIAGLPTADNNDAVVLQNLIETGQETRASSFGRVGRNLPKRNQN